MNHMNEYFLSSFAGLISFFSPCILPLFPVYLSTLSSNNIDSKNLTSNEILINTKDLTINKQKLISRLHLYTKKVLHIKINKIPA